MAWQQKKKELFYFLCICWGFHGILICSGFWKKFHVVWEEGIFFCVVFGRNDLCIYVSLIWFITSVSSNIFLFNFSLDGLTCLLVGVGYWSLLLSVYESQDWSSSSFSLTNVGLFLFLGIDVNIWNVVLVDFFFWWVWNVLSDFFWWTLVPSLLCCTQNDYSSLFACNNFLTFYPEVMSVLDVEIWFLDSAEGWILFSYLFC